jgi:hypothetical protein
MRGTQIFGLLLFTVAVVGCGGGSGDGDDDGTNPDGGDVDAPPAGYTRLIGRTWSVPAGGGGGDVYKCVRVTLTEDTYLTSIMAQAPLGSHHTVLSLAGGNGTAGPDGEQDCGVSTLGTVMLYASGVGTSPLDFPPDVGIKIAAGTQIHLNLHLYNASDETITGESAILVKQQSAAPPMLAEMVFAGKFLFQIPSNNQPYTTTGGCTANSSYNLFAVWPHQHKLGTHHKFEIIRGGNSTVLHDAAFAFGEQHYYLKDPVFAVQSGDQIRTTCTWVNNTGSNVTFGDSSDTEMCFTGLYRYPAPPGGTNLFACTDTGGAGF